MLQKIRCNTGSVNRVTCGIALCYLVLTAACSQAPETRNTQTVSFLGLAGEVPAAWQPVPPSSTMRLAQFTIEGGAELVVYYFGPGQGGTVGMNAARWSSQFSDAQGHQVSPGFQVVNQADPRVTLVELHGNYARDIGMATDAERLPAHALLAAVVESAQGNAYIQLWGPEQLITTLRQDYLAFLGQL